MRFTLRPIRPLAITLALGLGLATWCSLQPGCSGGKTAAAETRERIKGVEELATKAEIVDHMQKTLAELGRSRTLSTREADTVAKATALIKSAISSLENNVPFEPRPEWTVEEQADARRLLGVWRYRVNADGHENLAIFGPNRQFVGIYGGYQVVLADWACRGKALYQQNEIDTTEQHFENNWQQPSIFEIAREANGVVDLRALDPNVEGDPPTYTLTRIE